MLAAQVTAGLPHPCCEAAHPQKHRRRPDRNWALPRIAPPAKAQERSLRAKISTLSLLINPIHTEFPQTL